MIQLGHQKFQFPWCVTDGLDKFYAGGTCSKDGKDAYADRQWIHSRQVVKALVLAEATIVKFFGRVVRIA